MEIAFRAAARAWFTDLIRHTAAASQGSGFPVKTGALVRSLKPLGKFLRLSGILPSDSPRIDFSKWKDAGSRRNPPSDFTAEINITGVFSGYIKFQFKSNLIHHRINDFLGTSRIAETPWGAIEKANQKFVDTMEKEMQQRIDKIFDGWIEAEVSA